MVPRRVIIGASKNHLGACYRRELDRARLPPGTDKGINKHVGKMLLNS